MSNRSLIKKFPIILLFFIFYFAFSLHAEDWDDLSEGEKAEVYGSEKSQKYPVSNLFYEIEKWQGHSSVKVLWLYKTIDYPKFTSTRFFPFYSRLNSKLDNREKFRVFNYTYKQEHKSVDRSFFPLVFWGNNSGANSYYHSVLPIYGFGASANSNNDTKEFGFIPFPFYYSTSSYQIHGNTKHYDIIHGSLFHYRIVEEDIGDKSNTHKSVWGFPVLPVLFYSRYEQGIGSSKRVFTLLSWEKSNKQELTELSFLPFFMYKKNDYISIPLLLFSKDLASSTPAYGKTMMPLLLYYNKWEPGKEDFILGPYVSFKDDNFNEKFTTVFPIYMSSYSEKKEWSYLLPLYVKYNDKEADYSFNLIFSTRSKSGLIVDPGLNVGKKDDKWYVDSDFTFLYYLADFSFRKTLDKPQIFRNTLTRVKTFEELEEEKKAAQVKQVVQNSQIAKEDGKVKVSKKRSVTREDSLSFKGYSALFGLVSYEAADTKRHFRLLPLSWLTWDVESDDKIMIFPPFPPVVVWYKSEDLEYNVIFPFYGKQKDKDSEKRAYLINGLITEEYKTSNWKETSIVWPLINYYSSDTVSGHRVLPFYIQKNKESGEYRETTNYTLFSMYNRFESKNESAYIKSTRSLFIWPILSYYGSTERDKKNMETTLWLTPFFYKGTDNFSTHVNLFWFTDWEKKNEGGLRYLLVFPFFTDFNGFFFLAPVTVTKYDSLSNFWTFTLLNYISNDSYSFKYNFLFLIDYQKSKTSQNTEFNMLFGSIRYQNTANSFEFNGLWTLGWNFNKTENIWNDASFLWIGYKKENQDYTYNFLPVIRVYNGANEKTRIYGPLALYTSEDASSNFHLGLLGLGYWYTRQSSGEHDTYVLLGSLYREFSKKERGYISRGSLWGWLWEYQSEEETGFRKYSLLKMFSFTMEPDGTRKIIGIPF